MTTGNVKLHGLMPMTSPLAGLRNGAKPCTEGHLFPLLRTGAFWYMGNLTQYIKYP